jgi:GDPmannose 4,6-dehydratase
MKKIALVTGASGQDGSYLCSFLLKKKYKVIAADRRSSRNDFWRHKELNINNQLIYREFDLLDYGSIIRLIQEYKFNEIYNLAAQSFVGSSFNSPITTSEVTGMGTLRILEAIRMLNLKTKFYQASSSEMYGDNNYKSQSEKTKFNPSSPYAASKVFAHFITKIYRESYGMFACNGILFNHESPLRGEEFITRKITKQLSEIVNNKRKFIELGNINTKRDWGYAKDYVVAMWKILQQKKPEDFVIATGKSHTTKDFISQACKFLKLEIVWKGKGLKLVGINKKNKKILFKISKKYLRPLEVNNLRGNYNYAKKKLKWEPEVNFKNLVKIMMKADLQKQSK